jgi:hypothetical protein
LVKATNSRFIAVAGLEFAGRIFHEQSCSSIARALGSVRYTGLTGLVLNQGLVMSSMNASSVLHRSWRRLAFRWLMKQSAFSD